MNGQSLRRDTVLVTGCAGFIGMHVSLALLKRGNRVVGVDNLNNYYSPALKQDRLKILKRHPRFAFHKADLKQRSAAGRVFKLHRISRVCHLAAQAGVRYSIENPFAYLDSNLIAFQNIIHAAMEHKAANFVYASSSSVYGGNRKVPFSITDRVDQPVSLYAATKRSNELVAHAYSHIYGLPTTGLRFFTVYGPWGRPDMALFLFTRAILAGKPIQVFNHGRMERDFTYVDDVARGVLAALDRPADFALFNLGNNQPVKLNDFIACLERKLGKAAIKKYLPMQKGDVRRTCADIGSARRKLGFKPAIRIEEGIRRFVDWYREYYDRCG